MAKRNPHTGSRFDDFLKEEGIYDEVQARALKRALAESLAESMETTKLGKAEMARRMGTSRSQLERVLDPRPPPPGGGGSKNRNLGVFPSENQAFSSPPPALRAPGARKGK